ncbi:hypothetical protein [Flavobacterium psychrotrophum]|uniref:hypothetical protein n=1 Tax=Flavobacterium psychrotrophum TaxID=2294119 RepID=UPI000E31CE47|nr:hypothetical protein [Flavobacterium psychrotrophum]
MDYQIRIPDRIPMREQLEKMLYGLLTFIDAGSIYVSCKTGQPAIVTTILKKDCKQHGIMLERFSEKLARENPNTIFRFLDEKIARTGFKKGSPFLLMHCSLSELVYYEPKGKVFLPQYTNVERLLKGVNKQSTDDLNSATRQFEAYQTHISNNENENAAVSLYSAIWSVYTCFAAFFTGYLEEYYEYPEFDYVYDITNHYAPELTDILDVQTKDGEKILIPLQAAYNSSIKKHPIEPVEKSVLEQAEAKYQHLYAELENYYYRYLAGTKSKFKGFNQSLNGGASILKEKLSTNYFVDSALVEISEIIRGFVKVRAVYCFGYSVTSSNKKQRVFSKELPVYHFYLLVLNSEHRQNIVPELQALIKKKFNGKYTVTILQHRVRYLRNQAANQKHFINAVVRNGHEGYNNPDHPFHEIPVAADRDLAFSKNYWDNRMRLAEVFLALVHTEQPIILNVLMQQAVQQMTVGLIDLFMGYHPNIYSTNYLIRLLDCIPKLPKLFTNSEEDRRLSQLLSANIDMLKHKNIGQETIEDSSKLFKKAKDFHDKILVIGNKELERLEQITVQIND